MSIFGAVLYIGLVSFLILFYIFNADFNEPDCKPSKDCRTCHFPCEYHKNEETYKNEP